MYCGDCGNECEVHAGDDGAGRVPYGDGWVTESKPFLESDCCQATVYTNEALTREYDLAEYQSDCDATAAESCYDAMKDDG